MRKNYMRTKDEMDLLLSEREIKEGTKKFIVKKISMLNAIRLTTKQSGVAKRLMQDSEGFSIAISELSDVDENNKATTTSIRLLGFVDLVTMIGDDGVDFIKELIVKSTTMTDEDVEMIALEDSVDLIQNIYEVNEGFFTKFIAKVNEKLAVVKKKLDAEKKKSK